jgi:hypothetical protein
MKHFIYIIQLSVLIQTALPCLVEDEPMLKLPHPSKVLYRNSNPLTLKENQDSRRRNEVINFLNDEIEQKCLKGTRWHVRSQMCVPRICPGGNKFRNHITGECIRRTKSILKAFRNIPSLFPT